MRLRKRMASNNIMTDDQIAQSIVDNVINGQIGTIHSLLLDPYFDMKEENGQLSFSGKFEHLEFDENTVDEIKQSLAYKIQSNVSGNLNFEKKVKKAIKKVISNQRHLYNDFVNQLGKLTITNIEVDVIEKRDLQMYRDSAMIVFDVYMQTV